MLEVQKLRSSLQAEKVWKDVSICDSLEDCDEMLRLQADLVSDQRQTPCVTAQS